MHAGKALVESLKLHGVSRVFSVPGESYLAVLDGLYQSGIENIVCRHEGGACYMADASAKFTSKPGVAFVTRGPGAANAFVGIHTAWQDGDPVVLFVGLIPIADRHRESFQEFSPEAWFGTQAKAVFILDEPDRASEIVADAFFCAQSGRPGPVIVGLPEDIIRQPFDSELSPPRSISESPVCLDAVLEELEKAENPALFVGGERWTPDACEQLTQWAESVPIPVLQDWHADDRLPDASPANAGSLGYGRHQGAADLLDNADLVVCLGTVPGDVATDGFQLRQSPRQRTIAITPDPELRGAGVRVESHIVASPVEAVSALKPLKRGWPEWTAEKHQEFLDATRIPSVEPSSEYAHMNLVFAELQHYLKDPVYTVGAGNHTAWAQSFIPATSYPSQLSTRNGSMGYSIPAAVAATLETSRLVVAVCGDGEFLMNAQELATAVEHKCAFLAIVMDNSQFGTIRQHQENHYPGRVSGTAIRNPDFACYAQAFGAYGEKVTRDSEIADTVRRCIEAVHSGVPAVLHVKVDPEILQP
ncbi:thiamine pyrophosphate-dependent enzyme [Corynebacterium poyangense]|nr:thiamine pyrophosphate-dependent enzyme [Corynebacterium poyangense]